MERWWQILCWDRWLNTPLTLRTAVYVGSTLTNTPASCIQSWVLRSSFKASWTFKATGALPSWNPNTDWPSVWHIQHNSFKVCITWIFLDYFNWQSTWFYSWYQTSLWKFTTPHTPCGNKMIPQNHGLLSLTISLCWGKMEEKTWGTLYKSNMPETKKLFRQT